MIDNNEILFIMVNIFQNSCENDSQIILTFSPSSILQKKLYFIKISKKIKNFKHPKQYYRSLNWSKMMKKIYKINIRLLKNLVTISFEIIPIPFTTNSYLLK